MVQELLHLPQLCSNSQCHYSIFSLQGFNFTQLKVISIDFFVKNFDFLFLYSLFGSKNFAHVSRGPTVTCMNHCHSRGVLY